MSTRPSKISSARGTIVGATVGVGEIGDDGFDRRAVAAAAFERLVEAAREVIVAIERCAPRSRPTRLRPRAVRVSAAPIPRLAPVTIALRPAKPVASTALSPVGAVEHLLEQAAEHHEIVGIVGLLHRPVRDAARARADRHDREPQRGEDLEPLERADRSAGHLLVGARDVVAVA